MSENPEQPLPTDERRRRRVIALNRGVLWFSRNWAVVLTVFFLIYTGLPFAAPVAMEYGAPGVANVIYRIYNPLCHQFAFRSWFLFGDQTVYPRARAGVGGGTFEEYAAREPFFEGIDVDVLDADLIVAARSFVGSEEMGWKVAYCQRDVAIYGTIAIASLVFVILQKLKIKVPYLPFWGYVLIALAPIGLDGFSQLFANPPFNGFGLPIYPVRESTPFLRVLTGSLFGLGNAWLAYPYIAESMEETVRLIESKLEKAGVPVSAGR